MQDPWALPEKIGRYAIRKLIGRGSMGIVYLAHDPILARRVALKTISLSFAVSDAERKEFETRFRREADAARLLDHPGIVVVYDVGQDDETGTLYMALEHLRGKPLDALVALGEPLEWREALRTTARVAEALHHAHSRGVIHRDIKPANIMVLESGDPKVLDFGVARLPAERLTSLGRVLGSPAYMSPEQVLAGRDVDARTDIFSLGAVLYELLTGERAFRGANAVAIMSAVMRDEPPPPSGRNPSLRASIDAIVARALAKPPERRYADARQLAEDIGDVLAGRNARHAAPEGTHPPPVRLPPSRRMTAPPSEWTDPDLRELARAAAERDPAEPPPPEDAPARPSLPLDARVALEIRSGARSGEVLRLDVPRVVIGRLGAGGIDVELPDPLVSRAHAAIECYRERVVLRDLGSTNGTWIDGSAVLQRELADGDVFDVGRTRLALRLFPIG